MTARRRGRVLEGRLVSGRKVRELRERAGVRLAEFAEAAGCSYGYLKNIEGNLYQPSSFLVYSIARELSRVSGREVSIDEFTEITEPKLAGTG